MVIDRLGAVIFGLAVGWLASRLLGQKTTAPWIHTLTALGGIVAAVAVLTLFGDATLFGWYAIGLLLIVLAFVALRIIQPGQEHRQSWRETLARFVPAAVVPASTALPAALLPEARQPEESAPAALHIAEFPLAVSAEETSLVPDTADMPTAPRAIDISTATETAGADTPTGRTRGSKRSASPRKRAVDE